MHLMMVGSQNHVYVIILNIISVNRSRSDFVLELYMFSFFFSFFYITMNIDTQMQVSLASLYHCMLHIVMNATKEVIGNQHYIVQI